MRPTSEIQELLIEFNFHLIHNQLLKPASTRLYLSMVSAALRKHRIGFTDRQRLFDYFIDLSIRSPTQAHAFGVAWRHFVRFMAGRGVDVVSVDQEENNITAPNAAIFDLHQGMPGVTLTKLANSTWGMVQAVEGSDRLSILMSVGRREISQRFLLDEAATAAVMTLQKWGYRNTFPPQAHSYLIPSAPDVAVPISAQLLTRIIGAERIVRAQRAPLITERVFHLVTTPSTREFQHTPAPVQHEPQSVFNTFELAKETLAAAVDVTPVGMTDETKITHLNDWRARYPSGGIADFSWAKYSELQSWAGEKGLIRWRCIRWEAGLTNDFGPPPWGMPVTITKEMISPPRVLLTVIYTEELIERLVAAVDAGEHMLSSPKEREVYESYKAAHPSSSSPSPQLNGIASEEATGESNESTPPTTAALAFESVNIGDGREN